MVFLLLFWLDVQKIFFLFPNRHSIICLDINCSGFIFQIYSVPYQYLILICTLYFRKVFLDCVFCILLRCMICFSFFMDSYICGISFGYIYILLRLYMPFLKSSTFLLVLGIVSLSSFSHSNRCIVVSGCGFNLHFLND